MAYESSIPKHFTDAVITLSDGDGTPNTLTVQLCNGDYKCDGLVEGQKSVNKYYARGSLVGLRKANPKHPSLSFSAILAGLSDATAETLVDFCLKQGSFSTNVSTTVAIGDAYTIDVVMTMSYGAEDDHVVTAEDFHPELAIAEGEPNTISVSGEVLGTVTET